MNLKEGDALREGRERKKETEREFFFGFFQPGLPKSAETEGKK